MKKLLERGVNFILPIIILVVVFKLAGLYGIVGLIVGYFLFALYKVYRFRKNIIMLFNYSGTRLVGSKFKPNYEDNITFLDLFGLGKNKKR